MEAEARQGERMADVVAFPARGTEALVDQVTLAAHLAVTPRTIRRWARAGMPHVKRRNGTVRYWISRSEAWLANQ